MEFSTLRDRFLQACEAVGEPLCPNDEFLDTASDLIERVQSYLIKSHPVGVGDQLAQWMIQSFSPAQLEPYGILVNPAVVSDRKDVPVTLVLLDDQNRSVSQVTTSTAVTYRGGANASVFVATGEARLFGQKEVIVSPGAYLRAESVDRVVAAGSCEVLAFNCLSIEAREGVTLTVDNSFVETFGECYVDLSSGARLVSHQTGGEISTGRGAITLLMDEGANLSGRGLAIRQKDLDPAQVDLLIEQMRSIVRVPDGYYRFDKTLDDAKRAFLDERLSLFYRNYEAAHNQSPKSLIIKASSIQELADLVLPYISEIVTVKPFAEVAQYFEGMDLVRHNIYSSVYPMLRVDPEKPIHLFGNMSLSFEKHHPFVVLHEHAIALVDGSTILTGNDYGTAILKDKAAFVARDHCVALPTENAQVALVGDCRFVSAGASCVAAEGRTCGLAKGESEVHAIEPDVRVVLTDQSYGEFLKGSEGLVESPDVMVEASEYSKVYTQYPDCHCALHDRASLILVEDPDRWQGLRNAFLNGPKTKALNNQGMKI